MDMVSLARFIIVLGVVLLVIGGLLLLAARLNLPLVRLPGDFQISFGNATCMIALGTSIFLSIVLTILLNVIARLMNR